MALRTKEAEDCLSNAHQAFGHEMDERAKEIGILNSRIENMRGALEWIASQNPDGCCGNDDGEECVHECAGRILDRCLLPTPPKVMKTKQDRCERCWGKGTIEAMDNPNEIAGPFTKFHQVPCPRCEGWGVLE